jgi:hypothetical protein
LALHTDVPEFRDANRTREAEWLLVAMHHSGRDDHSDDLTLGQILDIFVDDLRQRGTISDRPDDETLARMILDEYIRFPQETPRAE